MMNWTQLLNPTRLGSPQAISEQARSPFHKDYDRIVFSSSFRQLNRKTQVHPLNQHDSIHTRLTHSLEVSCIGRSLGMMTAEKIQSQLPDWVSPVDIGTIIQAACLAHDIGNPPFGHAGEYAIRDWFDRYYADNPDLFTAEQWADLRQFEGNAQGLRILTQLDYHPYHGGMRLTYATLGTFIKYPWLSDILDQHAQYSQHRRKFGIYRSEEQILNEIATNLGLIQLGDSHYCRHPLVYLLEAADDICYALIDLEDGLHLNMLNYHEVEAILIELISDYGLPVELNQNTTWQQKISALRGRAMKRLVEHVSDAFVKQHELILAGQLQGHLLDYCAVDIAQGIQKAKDLAREKVYHHPQKSYLELTAYQSLETLLSLFIPLANPDNHQHFKSQRVLMILKNLGIILSNQHFENVVCILDLISKLSDHQAYTLAQKLKGNAVDLF